MVACFSSPSVNGSTVQPDDPCQDHWPQIFTRFRVYRLISFALPKSIYVLFRLCVLAFILICLPMIVVGVTKTKYLQLATSISRWTGIYAINFLKNLMFSLFIDDFPCIFTTSHRWSSCFTPTRKLSRIRILIWSYCLCIHVPSFDSITGDTDEVIYFVKRTPKLFDYFSSKSRLFPGLTGVYSIVLLFYFTLSVTGAFAFKQVEDVYTLNFFHDANNSIVYFLIDHFLVSSFFLSTINFFRFFFQSSL